MVEDEVEDEVGRGRELEWEEKGREGEKRTFHKIHRRDSTAECLGNPS